MTTTIGRFTTSEDPYDVTMRGDEVSFSIDVVGATVDDMKAQIQQLRGMSNNPDEDRFSFTWSEDSSFDGFYTDVQADLDDQPVWLSNGFCTAKVKMTRVPGYSRPLFETVTYSVLRDNAHAITTPTGVVAAYFAPTGYTWADVDLTELGTVSLVALTTADGTVNALTKAIPLTPWATWRSYVQPGDYYAGKVKIEIKYGSTWYPICGRQIPLGVGGNWRISNGYCRIYPSTLNTASRAITVETYRGGSWVGVEMTAYSYNTGLASFNRGDCTGTSTSYAQPAVVENRPEFAAVRVAVANETFTFSLRAGATWAEVQRASLSTASIHAAFGTTATVASTSYTGGIRATANDANGLRFLITRASAGATDLVNGRTAWSSVVYPPVWGITADYQAGVATTDTGVRDLYLACRADLLTVGAR